MTLSFANCQSTQTLIGETTREDLEPQVARFPATRWCRASRVRLPRIVGTSTPRSMRWPGP